MEDKFGEYHLKNSEKYFMTYPDTMEHLSTTGAITYSFCSFFVRLKMVWKAEIRNDIRNLEFPKLISILCLFYHSKLNDTGDKVNRT